MCKKRVACYIDGFNLYHAIADLKNESLKWVNLWSLTEAFIKPSCEILVDVFYFTALSDWLPNSKKRHLEYIKALEHFGVTSILGNFKKKIVKCRKCGASWESHEEKQSDVNLATYIIHHAHFDKFDKAFIVTADSDMCHAIDLLIESYPQKQIIILTPPDRYKITKEIRSKTDAIKIKSKHLRNNLLPETIISPDGQIIAEIPIKYKIQNI